MKLISWNVNGFRASVNKGFYDFLRERAPDILCLQEIKSDQAPHVPLEFTDYQLVWHPAERKGYSGTAVFTKIKPESVTYGVGKSEFDTEGRTITLEFPKFYLVNVYFPNSQRGLTRLDFKLEFNQVLTKRLQRLRRKKPVILCGDLNVAHQEIDIARPKDNAKNAGFTPQERAWMTEFLDLGYIDTFRHLHPEARDEYSWWTYRFNARQKNIGWRIDYFVVSKELLPHLKSAEIMQEVMGSDHAPVSMNLDL